MRAALPNAAKDSAQEAHVRRIKALVGRAARGAKIRVLQRAFIPEHVVDAEVNDAIVVVRMRVNLRHYNEADEAGKQAILAQRRDQLLQEMKLDAGGHARVVFQVDTMGWARGYLDLVRAEYDIDV
jgi:hypothetical protein